MASLQDHINSARRTGNIEFFIEERNADYVISRMPVASTKEYKGATSTLHRRMGEPSPQD
jgi:hypothetical protein